MRFNNLFRLNRGQVFKLVIAIAVCELAGIIGSFFTLSTDSGKAWYATLEKPALNPPSWIFAPVWTLLFALMGISLFIIWKNYSLIREDKRIILLWQWGIGLFSLQLILNILWSIIFFGLYDKSWLSINNIGWAFIEIVFLWIAILVTTFTFSKISKPAAWLLAPYIVWVSFAGYLNYSIWQLSSIDKSDQVFCTQEAKLCPDGSYVGRTGPKCEFASCLETSSLPKGYTLENYSVEKILGIACTKTVDCETPSEYLVQSRCPFTSLCLKNRCTVVCPMAKKDFQR